MTSGAELHASPQAERVAHLLATAFATGQASVADAVAIAEALERVGFRVKIPAALVLAGAPGRVHVERRRCGRTGCRCREPGALGHGPYAYRRWREGGRACKEFLGRVVVGVGSGTPRRLRRASPAAQRAVEEACHED